MVSLGEADVVKVRCQFTVIIGVVAKRALRLTLWWSGRKFPRLASMQRSVVGKICMDATGGTFPSRCIEIDKKRETALVSLKQ